MVTAYNSALTKMNEHNMEAMKKVRKLNKELDEASGTRRGWFG